MSYDPCLLAKHAAEYTAAFRETLKPVLSKKTDLTSLVIPCLDGKAMILFSLEKHRITEDEMLIQPFETIAQAFEETKLQLSSRNKENFNPNDFNGTVILVGGKQIIVMKDILATQNMKCSAAQNDANKIAHYGSDAELSNNYSMYKLSA